MGFDLELFFVCDGLKTDEQKPTKKSLTVEEGSFKSLSSFHFKFFLLFSNKSLLPLSFSFLFSFFSKDKLNNLNNPLTFNAPPFFHCFLVLLPLLHLRKYQITRICLNCTIYFLWGINSKRRMLCCEIMKIYLALL